MYGTVQELRLALRYVSLNREFGLDRQFEP